MNSFSFKNWVDYVRGLGSAESRLAMERTLQEGDPESRRMLELACAVQEGSAWLAQPEAPDSVVSRARSLFRPMSVESLFSLPSLTASLLFDSFLAPQPAGLRSHGALHRETVHQAGGFDVNLRMEAEPGTDVVAVVGQILPGAGPMLSVAHRPVFVFHRDTLVARTLSGENGEFQLEFAGRSPLRLVLALDEPERRLEIDLAHPGENLPGKNRRPSSRYGSPGSTDENR
jgi:hypothetical protein